MTDQKTSDIEQRAYEIWEAEGRPEGQAENHWQRAEAEQRNGSDSGAVEGGIPPMDLNYEDGFTVSPDALKPEATNTEQATERQSKQRAAGK